MIEKKYAILLSQLAIQKELNLELEAEYNDIDPIMSKLKVIKEMTDKVKEANKELHFNLKRHQDMLPLITVYQEQIKNNEKIINNLMESVNTAVQASPVRGIDIQEQLRLNYQDRKKLEEKTLQMNLYKDIYTSEEDACGYFERLVGSDPVMNKLNREREEHLVVEYQKNIQNLRQEIEDLSKHINRVELENRDSISRSIVVDPYLKHKKMDIVSRLENVEKREEILVDEVIFSLKIAWI
jgi:hypothetical protein